MLPIIALLALTWSPVNCLLLPSVSSVRAVWRIAPTLPHNAALRPPFWHGARHFVVRMKEDPASADAKPDEYSLSLEKRANMFHKELRKGPHVYGMEEKAYWEALTSYTAELFSDAPAEQARGLRRVRAGRAWYYLGKLAKAHPNTKEAAAYRMYDEAHHQGLDRVEQIFESWRAGLIDDEECRAQAERALARQRAVVALTNAFVPLERFSAHDRRNAIASARANDA